MNDKRLATLSKTRLFVLGLIMAALSVCVPTNAYALSPKEFFAEKKMNEAICDFVNEECHQKGMAEFIPATEEALDDAARERDISKKMIKLKLAWFMSIKVLMMKEMVNRNVPMSKGMYDKAADAILDRAVKVLSFSGDLGDVFGKSINLIHDSMRRLSKK